jgi:hypothetical protein
MTFGLIFLDGVSRRPTDLQSFFWNFLQRAFQDNSDRDLEIENIDFDEVRCDILW